MPRVLKRDEAGRAEAARRLCRFDGHTRVRALQFRDGTWQRAPRGMRLSPAVVTELRRQGVQQLRLRRRLRALRVPLRWIPPRAPGERLG